MRECRTDPVSLARRLFPYRRFVVWANIAAACEGVRRRVGELNSSAQVVQVFNHLHKEFFE